MPGRDITRLRNRAARVLLFTFVICGRCAVGDAGLVAVGCATERHQAYSTRWNSNVRSTASLRRVSCNFAGGSDSSYARQTSAR